MWNSLNLWSEALSTVWSRPRSVLLFAAVIESGELMRLEEGASVQREKFEALLRRFGTDSQTPLTAEQTLCPTDCRGEIKQNRWLIG